MAISLPDVDETALSASALAGDEEALGRLLALHERAAYNLAYRLLGSDADARDAVQEAALLAVRALRGDGAPPREVDRFRSWLLRVVANAALTQLRRRTPVPKLPLDPELHAPPTAERVGPAGEAERRETRADVLRALLALPTTQREALTLREYRGLSYEEIATALGTTRTAVETLLFRARRSLRAAYSALAGRSEPATCSELAPLLSAMLDDEVTPAAWAKLEAHLDACPRCRNELDELRQMRRQRALLPL